MKANINSILVVDDNKGDQLLAQLAIEDSQVTDKIFFLDNGEEAFDFLSNYEGNYKKEGDKFPPILVFLDINMPIMNGFEFLDKYKKLQGLLEYNSIVILMLTSSDNVNDIKKAQTYAPVKGYIEKPITEEKIKALITSIPELN